MNESYLAWMDRAAVDARVETVDRAKLGYDDCEARYLFRDRPFTGFSALRYPDGTLRSLTGFTDGIEHGVSVGWYPNGHIRLYAETAESVYHGIVVEWDENGTLIRISRYNLGLEVQSNPTSD
jgi:antitoxin component YwqK of YwqJK toxin-antitoxin module